jgi:ElaB/YqjD/DUF883 family membrane-anchored ribosome-binding protein
MADLDLEAIRERVPRFHYDYRTEAAVPESFGRVECGCGHAEPCPERTVLLALLAEVQRLRDQEDDLLGAVVDRCAERDRLRSERDELAAELDRLADELSVTHRLFDLQCRRMAAATDRWREESPAERALVSPDLGTLLQWLMDRADAAELASSDRPTSEEYHAMHDRALAMGVKVANLQADDRSWADTLLEQRDKALTERDAALVEVRGLSRDVALCERHSAADRRDTAIIAEQWEQLTVERDDLAARLVIVTSERDRLRVTLGEYGERYDLQAFDDERAELDRTRKDRDKLQALFAAADADLRHALNRENRLSAEVQRLTKATRASDVGDLVEASSLGTPEAKALRESAAGELTREQSDWDGGDDA